MKLSHSIEKAGFFWVPEDPEIKFPGTLNISENGEIILEISYLSDHSNHKITGCRYNEIDDDELWDIIIAGVIDQEDIILYKSRMIKKTDRIDGVSTMIFDISFALFGFEYEEGKEIVLSNMKFSMEGLREWLFLSGISTQNDYETRNYTISSEPLSSLSMGNHDNFDLEITFGRSFNRAKFDVNITQEAYFCLISEKLRPLHDFLDMIYKVRSFLCLAIDRMISIKSITSYSIVNRPIKIYYKSFPSSDEIINIHRYGMLFSYSDIRDRFDHVIKKWLDGYNAIKPVFRLYFASSSMFDTYSPERFLLLVRAIEVFHRKNFDGRRFSDQKFESILQNIASNFSEDPELESFVSGKMQYANEISLRKRIKQIIYPFQNLFESKKQIKSFAGKVTDTRNYLTHYNSNLENKAATKGEDIYELCIKLEALLQLHFLKLMDMDVESIEIIARNNNHLRHKLDLD